MAGFTKGPWSHEWNGEGKYTHGEVASPSALIAIVCGSNYGEWRDAEDNGEAEFAANACLIAAAPELLDALENLVETLNNHECGEVDYRLAIKDAAAAIAKAKGQADGKA